MKIAILLMLLASSLGGCVLLAAGAAGYGLHEHRDWCRWHTGNPYCYRHMPMGVHR